jgi:hypothetical protein
MVSSQEEQSATRQANQQLKLGHKPTTVIGQLSQETQSDEECHDPDA